MSTDVTKEPRKLTQLGVNQFGPPETGRDIYPDTVLPGFQLRVSQSGLKSYSLLTRHGGKVIRVGCGKHGKEEHGKVNDPITTLAEAQETAREALRDIRRGVDPSGEKPEEIKNTDIVDDVVEDFLEKYKGRRERPLAERTKEENSRALRKRFVPYFEGRPIATIRRRELIEFLEEMAEATPGAAHRAQSVLSTFFDWCTDREILETNPAVRLRAARKPASRDRVLSDAEIEILWSGFGAAGYPYGSYLKMLLLTAARRSEVSTMRWDDIDGSMWKLSNTKTGAPRDVPLSTLALDILADIQRDGPYVFTFAGQEPITGFVNCKKAVKVDIVDWRFHDLRRTAATNLAELKIPRIVIMAVLGHSDGSVTSIYDRHDYVEEKTHALQMWADKIERLTGGALSNDTPIQEARV